jgi:DNA-directed RNA polymerase subunit RPC12/RpoP
MKNNNNEEILFLSMPNIKCLECGNPISLPSSSYQNVENADVNCVQCNARLMVTFENGELKQLTKGEPTS